MSEQELESSPIISEWGIPDWREASAYPDEKMDLWSWRWEFLRRGDEYRKDWLQYAPETYEKNKADYEANPLFQTILGYSQDTGEPVIRESSKVLLSTTDLNFCAEMPGAMEKYQLPVLPHPANPDPQFLCFGSGDIKGVMWRVGRGEGLSNYWGVEYSVLDHELALRFDLTTKPARELMASLTLTRSLSSEGRQQFGMDETTKSNILNWFQQHDYAPFPSLKECPPSQRTHVQDPQHSGMVHVIWDRRLPYGQQQKDITALLTLIQENLPNKPGARRARPSAWANFLRVLDARAINPEKKKPYATYEAIGKKVYGCKRYSNAKAQAKTAHDDALRLTTDFPL